MSVGDQYTKCIEFFTATITDDRKNFMADRHLLDPVRIKLHYPFYAYGWVETCDAFRNGSSTSAYPYLKSCEYSEKIVKESTEIFDLKLQDIVLENENLKCEIDELKENQTNKFIVVEKEIDELKSLLYSSLDEINQLKEHNKSLSSRVSELESLFEKREIPDLINF